MTHPYAYVRWRLALDCGTTVIRDYTDRYYPAVNIFDCPCPADLSCAVVYRDLIESKLRLASITYRDGAGSTATAYVPPF